MPDDITFDVNLDPQGYVTGASQIQAANQRLSQSFTQLGGNTATIQRTLGVITTPTRLVSSQLNSLSSAAADAEQSFSSFRATAATTGASYDKLTDASKQLARDFPIGAQAAKQVVTQFTQMGVAGKGSEEQLAKLSKTVVQLSGATGEGPGQLAEGMTNLARATGNTNLDPQRFSKMADSVTKVSASAGASATSILAFGKNIAPFAQSIGIGTTSVLGISGAFARMGEDGAVASNAVGKMMADLNKSLRTGSPEIKAYAEYVGMTVDQYKALAEADPTEAVSRVIDSIGKAGPQGQRMLERIGIEGIRGQRAVGLVSAGGGFSQLTKEAREGYGSGATAKAAEEAYGGLNDAMTELTETTHQVAEALGTPLLGGLTALAKGLKGPMDLARQASESDITQKVLQIGGAAGMAVLAGKFIGGPLAAYGAARQAVTSSVTRGFFHGYAMGDTGSRAARFGAQSGELYAAEGVYGRGIAAGPAARAVAAGEAARVATEERRQRLMGQPAYAAYMARRDARMQAGQDPADPRGPSPLRGMFRNIRSYTTMIGETYGNIRTQTYGDPSRPIAERGSRTASAFGFPARATLAAEVGRQGFIAGGGFGNPLQAASRGLGDFHRALTTATTAQRETSNAIAAHGRALRAVTGLMFTGVSDATRAGRVVGGAALGAAGRGIAGISRSALGLVGGPVGAAVAGGFAAWQLKSSIDAMNEANKKSFAEMDINKTFNAYRESIGKATEEVKTNASLTDAWGKAIAKHTLTWSEATRVTEADIAIGRGRVGQEPTHRYIGTVPQITSQISQNIPAGGTTPDVIAAIKQDLLGQGKTSGEVEAILQGLPASAQQTPGARSPLVGPAIPDRTQSINAIANAAPDTGFGSWYSNNANNPKGPWNVGGSTPFEGPRHPFYTGTLSKDAVGSLNDLTGAINKDYDARQKYGPEYAQQERIKDIQQTYDAIAKTGNVDLLKQFTEQTTSMLGGKEASSYFTPDEVSKAGGLAKALAEKYPDTFGKQFHEFEEKQKQQPGGEYKGVLQPGYISDILKNIAPTFSKAFSEREYSATSGAFAESAKNEFDAGKLTNAADVFVDEATKSGKSLADLANEAQQTAGAVDATGIAFKQAAAVMASIERQAARNAVNETPMQTESAAFTRQLGIARTPRSNTEVTEQQRTTAEEGTAARVQSYHEAEIQRLQMQKQFEIARKRQNEDTARAEFRTRQDYETQVSRTVRNYGTQRERAIFDYNKSVERANEDHHEQLRRQERDFNLGLIRAEHDYQLQRSRQLRDFNIGIARQIEDAAKTMYDPYTRIQTKATWDAKNLLVNMKEQNDALAKQKTQLDELRKMGVSSQVIDQLQLGKTENAQQVNNLVQDLGKSPELADQLNAMAKNRAGLTGAMFLDQSNVELKRGREDLQKTLDDQETDYNESIARTRENMRNTLADQAWDFQHSMERSAQDFQRTLQRNEHDLAVTLGDMAHDLDRGLDRMHEDTQRQTERMIEDLHNADLIIAGDFKSIHEQTMKAMAGQTVQWSGITHNATQELIDHLNNTVIPQVFDAAGKLNITLPGMPGGTTEDKSHDYGPGSAGHVAEGGPINGFSPHEKADNIPAWLTAGEFVHPVATVNYYGGRVMEALRRRAIPRQQMEDLTGGQNPGVPGSGFSSNEAAVKQLASGGMDMSGIMIGEMMPAFAEGGRVAGRTGSQALAAAMKQVTNVVNTCLSVVQEWWQSGHAFPTAYAQWLGTAQHPGDRNPPIGAPIFTKGRNAAGHIAVYAGNGMARGTDSPTPGRIGTVPLSYFEGSWGHQYLGWGSTLAGSGLRFDVGPDGKAAPAGAYPTAAGAAMPSRPQVDYDKLFAGFDNNRKGSMYPLLRDMFKTKIKEAIEAKLDAQYAGASAFAGPVAAGGPEVDRFIAAIVKQETGGEPDPYKSRWGKYAITPSLVNSLAMKYLGHSMSAQEYLSSPQNQDLLGRAALTSLYNQYGVKGAASSWYSGNPNLYNSTRPQPGGPSIKSYVDSVLRYMGYDKGGMLAPGQTMTENATGKPEAVLTDEQWTSISKLAQQAGTLISNEQGKQLTAAGGIHLTIDKRTINNDYRTDMTGAEITVVTADPDELGRKMRQKEWASRATATRGVNRAS